jgi:hypothetical protein
MNKTLRTVIVSALVSAAATTGALILVGPYDSGPWPLCAYEDGNPGGDECIWINDGRAWYNDGAEYRNDN